MIVAVRSSTTSRSQTQNALSSAEAEYYAQVGIAAECLLSRNVAEFLTKGTVHISIWTDSSSAKSIAERLGVGSVKHLHNASLWLQDAIKLKIINIHKVGTKDNPADIGTALQRSTLEVQLSLNKIQELKIDLDKVPVGQVKKAGRETATMTIAGLEKCGMCVNAEELQFLQRILSIKKLMGDEWPKGMNSCE